MRADKAENQGVEIPFFFFFFFSFGVSLASDLAKWMSDAITQGYRRKKKVYAWFRDKNNINKNVRAKEFSF